jgi:MFS family permease
MKKSDKFLTINQVTEDHPIIKRKIDKSLKLSIKEGSYAATSTGFGAAYFGPFALFLGATVSQMSFLHGLAGLLPSITQLYSSHLIEKNSRKKTVMFSVVMDIILLSLIALLGVLYFFDIAGIWTLLFLIGLFYLGMGIGQPAWFSWMGSIIPGTERGKYLSKRTKAASVFGLIAMLLSAFLLDYLKRVGISRGQELIFTLGGFIFFFVLAATFRILSAKLLLKQYEPHLKIRKKDKDGFFHFLKNSNKTTLGKFSWFNFAFRIAIGIAAPFYVIFLLKEYQFSYFWYMAFVVSGTLFQIAFLPIMGKISDKFGNIALVKSCSIALAIIPLITAASILIPSKTCMILFLILIPQMFTGFGWAGFNLATNNYIYDSTSQQKRGYALSHMNLLAGIGLFIGTIIASSLSHFNISFLSVSVFALILSGILRLSIVLLGRKTLREVREVAPFPQNYFLHEIHPLRGTLHQIHHLNHEGAKIIHHI